MSDSSIIKLELKNKKIVSGKLESYENTLIELTDAYFLGEEEITYRIFIKEKDVSKILNCDEQDIIRMPDSVKDWNQFEANERLFGIKPEFNEADYTTVLDKNSEFYLKNVARAKKIEHDILTSKCSDRHRMEERGLVECENEEDRYSAVLYKKKGRKNGKNGKKGEKETERSWNEGEKKIISQGEERKTAARANDTKDALHGVEKKGGLHTDVEAHANDTKDASHGVDKKGGLHVDVKKGDKANDDAVHDGLRTDKKVPHDTHKKHTVDSKTVQTDKPCESTSSDKLSKPKGDTKGPVSLKGVSYKKNVSSTFKTIKEYIESITSRFTGSLAAAGRWGNGDSYKIINDDKPVKNLFGRKR